VAEVNPGESKGLGCLVETKVRGAKVEPTGRDDLRPEAEPVDLSAQALMVVAGPEARPECLALQEMTKG
jgi:hypothetical protein